MTNHPQTHEPVTPDQIMQVGLGFWASKTLLSAIEMELFTELAKHPENAEQVRARDDHLSRRGRGVRRGRDVHGEQRGVSGGQLPAGDERLSRRGRGVRRGRDVHGE